MIVATLKQQLVSSAIGLVQSLVDNETWEHEFRSHFEHPELFHSLKLDMRADMWVFDLFVHNPQELNKLINYRLHVRPHSRDSDHYSCTAEGARELTQEFLTNLSKKK